jgi:D-methionine transport system substrate-binding protein
MNFKIRKKEGLVKMMKKMFSLLLGIFFLVGVVTNYSFAASKKIIFGVAPGPYGDMVKKAIQPSLEKKGYTVEIKEFTDYVQPDLALGNKEIDVNLFQHSVYLEKFAKDNNLKLSPVISVPTAAAAIYSHKIKSIKQLKKGSQVTIPNDPTNLARALRLLQAAGLIKIKASIDPTKASEKDIVSNPKNLKIQTVEAAQLPRTLDSTDIAVINGNYAISAGIKLSSAIVNEKLAENYKNVIAVRTEDLNSQFVKDIKEIVKSAQFRIVIESAKNIFKDFQKPDWYLKAAK